MIIFILGFLIVLGVTFIFIETFLLPGGGIVGALGGILLIGAVWVAFEYFGSTTGYWVLAGTGAVTIYAIVFGFRKLKRGDWAVKNQLEERVHKMPDASLQPGVKGVSLTELRPFGKAVFDGKRLEVSSTGDYIAKDTQIQIVRVQGIKILVEPEEEQ